MTFKLYLELASRVQDADILNLLRFPVAESASAGEWSARWWAHGRTSRSDSPDRETILRQLAERGVNEVDLEWRSGEVGGATLPPLHLTELWAFFSPSPTGALWAPVPTEKLASRENERIRRSMGEGHPPNRKEFRLPHPSTAEFLLTFNEPTNGLSDQELQNSSIEWICSAIPTSFQALDCFGYGCVHGACRRMNMVRSLGGVAGWEDQLGEKFENIYPILFGSVSLCRGLKAALGDRCSLIPIPNQPASAVISISPDLVDEIRREPAVHEWVVLRDVGKLNAPAATLDEIYRRNMAIPALAPFFKR